MKFGKAIPILYSADVSKSIVYFVEQLKFENQREWDNPPTFGLVYRNNVEIFLSKMSGEIPVIWLALVVDSGTKILSVPETKEWRMREMLVECPDRRIMRIGHNTSCD